MKHVLGEMPTLGTELPVHFPPLANYDDPMASAMTPLIGAYWDEAGKRTMARLGLQVTPKDSDEWKVTNPHTKAKIESAALAFCHATNATTSKNLADAIDKLRSELIAGVVDHGETIDQLTKRVQGVFEHADKWRARQIAHTEASRAVHAAQEQAAIESGVVVGFEWLLSADACPLCQMVATQCPRVEIGQDFAEVGHNPAYSRISHPPLHPGCRCAMTEILSAEYGGPENPEFTATLDQPKPGDDYKPPEGTEVPKPDATKLDHDKLKLKPAPIGPILPSLEQEPIEPEADEAPAPIGDPILPGRPIAERLAAYAEGDRKVAEIAAMESFDELKARRDLLERRLKGDKALDWPESKYRRKMQEVRDLNRTIYAKEKYIPARAMEVLVFGDGKAVGMTLTGASGEPQQIQYAREVSALLSGMLRPGANGAVAVEMFTRGPSEVQRSVEKDHIDASGKKTASIHITKFSPRQTTAHELAHAIEAQVPGIHAGVLDFLDHRCGSEPFVSMDSLYPGVGYGAHETGRKDHFDRFYDVNLAYYAGKVYKNKGGVTDNSEVISMGVEALFSDPVGFCRKDPEWAKFIMGMLDGSLR